MTNHLGGQAVIEGVMVCSKDKIAVAVRKNDGSIKKTVTKRSAWATRWKNILFLRGLIALFEMLYHGTKALSWSSNQQLEEDEQIGGWGLFFTLLLSLILAIGLFVLLPLWLSNFFSQQRIIFNLVDGLWRIAIFIGYLLFISRFKDIRRVFQYHAAEHMSIHCYEEGKPLTVKNVRKYSPIHPRCGTSFIFIVLLMSIILFSFVWSEQWILKFVYRIVLIPVIGMLSYEVLKLSAKYQQNVVLSVLTKPGLWFQKITTQPPDDQQIKVGIAAVKAAL